MAAVEYRRIDKTYPDGSRALQDLNLRIEDGEMMVLVGPSGCGKSTAALALATFLAALEATAVGTAMPTVVAELKSQLRRSAPRLSSGARRISVDSGKGITGAKFVRP